MFLKNQAKEGYAIQKEFPEGEKKVFEAEFF